MPVCCIRYAEDRWDEVMARLSEVLAEQEAVEEAPLHGPDDPFKERTAAPKKPAARAAVAPAAAAAGTSQQESAARADALRTAVAVAQVDAEAAKREAKRAERELAAAQAAAVAAAAEAGRKVQELQNQLARAQGDKAALQAQVSSSEQPPRDALPICYRSANDALAAGPTLANFPGIDHTAALRNRDTAQQILTVTLCLFCHRWTRRRLLSRLQNPAPQRQRQQALRWPNCGMRQANCRRSCRRRRPPTCSFSSSWQRRWKAAVMAARLSPRRHATGVCMAAALQANSRRKPRLTLAAGRAACKPQMRRRGSRSFSWHRCDPSCAQRNRRCVLSRLWPPPQACRH